MPYAFSDKFSITDGFCVYTQASNYLDEEPETDFSKKSIKELEKFCVSKVDEYNRVIHSIKDLFYKRPGGIDSSNDEKVCGKRVLCKPEFKFSSTHYVRTNGTPVISRYGSYLLEYGFYPQNEAENDLQGILDKALKNGDLEKTDFSYTIGVVRDKYYELKKCEVYEFNGNKYIHNGAEWIEVAPVKWLLYKDGIMTTRDNIIAGVMLDQYSPDDNSGISTIDIRRIMSECFQKELVQGVVAIPFFLSEFKQQFEDATSKEPKVVEIEEPAEPVTKEPAVIEESVSTNEQPNVINEETTTIPKVEEEESLEGEHQYSKLVEDIVKDKKSSEIEKVSKILEQVDDLNQENYQAEIKKVMETFNTEEGLRIGLINLGALMDEETKKEIEERIKALGTNQQGRKTEDTKKENPDGEPTKSDKKRFF